MDREETIRISKLANFGGLTEADVNMVLMQYCIEHKKPYYETAMFVVKVLSDVRLLKYCFSIALNYYERKFIVYKLYSAPSLMASMKQNNQLLQIF